MVAATSEMNAVTLAKAVFCPCFHRIEAAHNRELIPNHAARLLCDAVKCFADKRTILVDVEFAFSAFVAVVVGDEYEGAVGANGTYGINKSKVALAEDGGVVVRASGIVNAYAKDDEVWLCKA